MAPGDLDKTLAGDSAFRVAVARLTRNGTLDATFPVTAS
jgi:hypothetical protein